MSYEKTRGRGGGDGGWGGGGGGHRLVTPCERTGKRR